MFQSLSASVALFASSWSVLRSHPRLLIFPVFSGIASVLVFASFLMPFACNLDWFVQTGADGNVKLVAPPTLWIWGTMFVYYFCNFFVIVFFNAALVSCVLMHFNGEEPTLEKGLRAATSRLPQVLGWALVSASVGILLKAVESSNKTAGHIVSAVLGTAWSIITYFVMPVLVVERVGPIEAVKRSVTILKKTWKEGLAGHIGLGFLLFVLWSIGSLLFFGTGIAALIQQVWVVGAVFVALGVLYSMAVATFGSAMNSVYRCALYHYATEGEVPGGFDADILAKAFSR
jgi:hypothetical protein